MNTGTKIRSALAIALAFYAAVIKTDLTTFGNPVVDTIYQIVMKAATFAVIFLVTYYNNDYTIQACEGTGYTRQLKAVAKGEMVGVDVEGLDYIEDGDEDE